MSKVWFVTGASSGIGPPSSEPRWLRGTASSPRRAAMRRLRLQQRRQACHDRGMSSLRGLALVLVTLASGCFSDETLLTGGSMCREGTGWYCGFDGVPGDKTHLYYCPKSATATTAAIDLGRCPAAACTHGDMSGVDRCAGGSSRTMQFGYPGYGWWCGEAFTGGVAGHLYFFDDDWGADLGACPNGCAISGTNVADACR